MVMQNLFLGSEKDKQTWLEGGCIVVAEPCSGRNLKEQQKATGWPQAQQKRNQGSTQTLQWR